VTWKQSSSTDQYAVITVQTVTAYQYYSLSNKTCVHTLHLKPYDPQATQNSKKYINYSASL